MVAVVAILLLLDVLFLLGWLSLYGSGLAPPATTRSAFYVRDLFFAALVFDTLAVTALHVHNLLLLLGLGLLKLGEVLILIVLHHWDIYQYKLYL